MAALDVDDPDFKFHKATLDNTATASRFQGPHGGARVALYLETAGRTVRVQVGDDVVQGATNLATDNVDQGPSLRFDTWTEIDCSRVSAGQKTSARPAFFLQADGATVVRYRWLPVDGDPHA